jgi:hypothetical protein
MQDSKAESFPATVLNLIKSAVNCDKLSFVNKLSIESKKTSFWGGFEI